MTRLLYSLCLYLLSPLLLLRLFWRGRRQPGYRKHWDERFGRYHPGQVAPLIWVHAVSVGETRAAQPLLAALQRQYPAHHLLLTGMTPTGRETARQVMAALPDPQRVSYCYLPYDFPGATRRFFRRFRPALGILMETELWPNLLAAAKNEGVPVVLANARLSEKSARGYGRFKTLAGPALAGLQAVLAQSESDAERFRQLGAARVEVCGNLKFDVLPSPSLLAQGQSWRQQCNGRSIWLAASTREGEEALILDMLPAIGGTRPLLVLVPRHPQRFDQVAALLTQRGLRWQRRSQGLPEADTQVWLGDSMGEMAAYYAMADLALIGGSLLPFGGQNLIEAAACGCPTLMGPHAYNFAQATADATAAQACLRVDDAQGAVTAINRLLQEPSLRTQMAAQAGAFARLHQGATQRTLEKLATLLTS